MRCMSVYAYAFRFQPTRCGQLILLLCTAATLLGQRAVLNVMAESDSDEKAKPEEVGGPTDKSQNILKGWLLSLGVANSIFFR